MEVRDLSSWYILEFSMGQKIKWIIGPLIPISYWEKAYIV